MNNVACLSVAHQLQKVAVAGGAMLRMLGRAPTRMSPALKTMVRPDFQEVLRASSGGFPRMSGLPVTNIATQRAILSPKYQMPGYTRLSGLAGSQTPMAQAQLLDARTPLARVLRGYRQLRGQGVLQ